MVHEILLIVTTRGETIGTIIHHEGDEMLFVEGEEVFPRDCEVRHESISEVCEDGALLYTLTECSGEEPVATEAAPRRH
jgi:hypothetical protein